MPLQPLLHDKTVVLRAPAQAWSSPTGEMGQSAIDGFYLSDVRVLSDLRVEYGTQAGELIATIPQGADTVTFVSLLRHLDDASADPRVRALHRRTVIASGMSERITIASTLHSPISTTITVQIASDLADMDVVKAGMRNNRASISVDGDKASWAGGSTTAELSGSDATISVTENGIAMNWSVTVPAKGEVTVGWRVDATVSDAVVAGVSAPVSWASAPAVTGDDRLDRWVARALDDLEALRMTTVADPASVFLAAGAPWFFTLFGRDSIWAARFMLPLGTTLAADTLRVLAGMQGTRSDDVTAEQPGKIMHELRRSTLEIPGENISLPPLYYGTVDATALWICLLHDAWTHGMPDAEVEALLPHLVAALEWMRDYGDADGDGLLEYVDTTGHGLANQGWKDSGDSVQWRDGSLATGPIALCEVQAYGYEAAIGGAALLEHFAREGSAWREWAAALKARFHEAFWIDDPDGAYPAIALDSAKRPVDTVTSNIGHLLGTGILDPQQSALVARRLDSPELNSGFGLRTMSTRSAGYWPLSYHGGSVWTHDTAIAIRGLASEGFVTEAAHLSDGLLAAASGFGYRMPELHSGDPATEFGLPIPYPAACRPQAWSAAAAIAVMASRRG